MFAFWLDCFVLSIHIWCWYRLTAANILFLLMSFCSMVLILLHFLHSINIFQCSILISLLIFPLSSVQLLSRVWLFTTAWTAAHRPPCPLPTPGVYPNSCPLNQWCHPTISSSVIPFSSPLQSLPASGSFQISQCFTSGGQSIGVSASASVLPMNIQDWFPLGCTGWISLQSKGLSRVFSNTTVKKHQFFSSQISL